MAFCPHCGKSVTDQASKCLACSQEFEPRAKAARFKGTMMMQPTPGASPGIAAAPVAPKPAPVPPAVPKPEAAAAAPAARAAAPAPSKVGKGTMLGTGGAGLAPPAARASIEALAATLAKPPPAPVGAAMPAAPAAMAAAAGAKPSVPEPEASHAQTARLRTEASVPHPDAADASHQAPTAAAVPREDSQRFLVGDPMAPTPTAPAQQREGRIRRSLVLDRTDEPRTGILVSVGVAGMVMIATVGYFTARYLGLL